MARPRIDVQGRLETAMSMVEYTPHVYYQPPESIKLAYPCIVYGRDNFDMKYANDHIYKDMTKYTVTVMDVNPVSPLVDVLRTIPYCRMDREFTTTGIHHFIFTLFY